ncbi:MAG: SDR family NAD(P)-dependent oxidoreductase [Planctomycetes bacterium]|nr:SDR family NAD(P)-dependent oxidoreductase [Planctomycetota bacterium]MCB9903780.1 SDR family NAD(P)-dependent oxidoreductase [Planctomycetota bacterium]
MTDMKDRLALVTGASSGIGEAVARALHGAGCRMVLAARRRERLAELAAELGDAQVVALDVRDADAVLDALQGLELDIAVANAGLAYGTEPVQAGNPAEWSEVVDTNVKGVLNVARAVLPGMIARGRGDFVTMGSVAGRQLYPGGTVYCATKHAVKAIYEGMRLDCAGSGVRFTTVDPGMVQTDFSLVRFRGDAQKAAAVYAGVDALQPADVADALLYAVSRPPHVNIGEIVMWASAQASASSVTRRPAGS